MPYIFLADFGLFIGRFHPLLVHLPIGFLLLAAFLEWWPGDRARPAIRAAWVLGALSAVAAAFAGWLLSGEAGGGDTLWWHKWLGISVAVLAVVGVFVTNKGGTKAKGFGILVATLLSVAGHQGGNLTHGEDYLFQHAPEVVRTLAGHDAGDTGERDWSMADTDSINLYAEFLRPALNASCVKCHNAGKQNGGLRMDEAHLLFLGGESGPAVKAEDLHGSLWYKRVTLPRANVKAMPPQGEPWDFAEIKLLEYWIAEGADTLAVLDPQTTPEEIKELLRRDFGLDLRPKLFVEKISASRVPARKLTELETLNWAFTHPVPDGGALEAKPAPGKTIDASALAQLAENAPDQIAYLSLERLPLTDDELKPLSKFKNLNRLRLNGTAVTAATVQRLAALPHLESLNLYDTEVTDDIFAHLQRFPALKRLYLWQTNVTPAAAGAFAEANPDVAVDVGFQFPDQKSK